MSALRVAIGRISHESNSFCRQGTQTEDFASFNSGMDVGLDLLGRPKRIDEVRGLINVLANHEDVEIIPLLSTTTPPSGLVTAEAVGFIEEALRSQLRQAGPLDGMCFALHGAMSGQGCPDLDGHFLQIIRDEVGSDVRVVCSLDCHAVVTRQMVDLTDALVAFRTHPHSDVVETGQRAASILVSTLQGKIRPVMRCRKIPMLFCDSGTDKEPLKRLFEELISWDETRGVIACSLCPSYPFQDVSEQGWAAIAVTDHDEALAQCLCDRLAKHVWDARKDLLPVRMLSPEEAIRKAAAVPGRPVIVTDSADNVGSGTPGDTTAILQAVLDMREQVDGLILLHIPDAAAVSAAAESPVGQTVSLDVGGKRDSHFGLPVSVRGRVLCIAEGSITDDGRFSSEPTIDAGTIVSLEVDNVRLVLTERVIHGPQPSLFRKVGIEPFDAKIVVVKSGIGHEVTYGHVASAVLHTDCPGPGSRNVANFNFRHVPRPIFPLDPDMQWHAEQPDATRSR